MKSPLRLERSFIKELHFTLRDDFIPPASPCPDPQINVNIMAGQRKGSPRNWAFTLTIAPAAESAHLIPFEFKIVMHGLFEVDKDFPEDRADLLAKVNAPSLLYSAAREVLMQLSGRNGYPPFILPTITFLEPEKKQEEQSHPPVGNSQKKSKKKTKATKR